MPVVNNFETFFENEMNVDSIVTFIINVMTKKKIYGNIFFYTLNVLFAFKVHLTRK